MLNPINHTRTAEGVERYQGEPYVVAADVYAHPMHVGRVGWTWYTGSAGWMYQAAIEGILGLRRSRVHVRRESLHPADVARILDGVEDRRDALPHQRDESRAPMSAGVASAALDGIAVDPGAIPLTRGRPDTRRRNRPSIGKRSPGDMKLVVRPHHQAGPELHARRAKTNRTERTIETTSEPRQPRRLENRKNIVSGQSEGRSASRFAATCWTSVSFNN